MSARVLAFIALALAILGGALGLPFAPGGPVLVFAVATVAALGTRAGVLLGALTLIGGLSTAPIAQPTLMLPAAGMALAGLGLGLLSRELDRLARTLPSALITGAITTLLLALTLIVPAGPVLLASASGAPLLLPTVVVDGGTFMRSWVEVPALVPLPSYGASLTIIALTAALLAGLFLLIVHLRGSLGHERRAAWGLAGLAAGLALITASLGIIQLLSDRPELDPASLRTALELVGSRDGGVIDLAIPPAELRLWSRPWIDGLRLLLAGGLGWLAVCQLRRTAAPTTPPLAATGLTRLVPIAMALTALGAALVAATHGLHGAPLALLGGLALGVGALVAGRNWSGVALAPRIALFASATIWVYAWLVTPLFGA